MEIEAILQDCLIEAISNSGVPAAPSLVVGDNAFINLEIDDSPQYPRVFLDQPSQYGIAVDPYVNENYQIVIMFFALSKFDNTPAQDLAITQDMRPLVRAFCVSVQNSPQINKAVKIQFRATEAFKLFDECVNMIMLTFSAKSLNLPIC